MSRLQHPNHPHPSDELLKPTPLPEKTSTEFNPELDLQLEMDSKFDFAKSPLIPKTFGSLDEATLKEISNKTVEHFLAENKHTQHLSRDIAHHQDDSLQDTQDQCVVTISRKGSTIPPDRVFSVLTPDNDSSNEDDVAAVCFDIQDLIRADKEKPKLSRDNPNFDLIPNVALNNSDFDLDPKIVQRYNLGFQYWPATFTTKIRAHEANFIETQVNRDLIDAKTTTSFVKDILTPILEYLFLKVDGLFDAIFGTGFIARFTKKVAKGLGWLIKKIFHSVAYLTKFIWNNPFFLNLAIYILNILKIIWCVWYQGPSVGLESLGAWAAKQWTYQAGSGTWKALIALSVDIAKCTIGNLWSCIQTSMQWFFKVVWRLSPSILSNLTSVYGFEFMTYGIPGFLENLFGPHSTALRKEAAGYAKLDWPLFYAALPLLLPKLLQILLQIIPIPKSMVKVHQVKKNILELLPYVAAVQLYLNNYIGFLWNILTTIWYCARGSKECCFPSTLKEKYSIAIAEEKVTQKKGYFNRALEAMWSDDRIKQHLNTTNFEVNGLRIHMYMLRSDFLQQLGLEKSITLPKWIRNVKQHQAFWNRQVFFGVSAQEVQKKYPEAVQSYCFATKTKKKQRLPRCIKYILLSKLPTSLQQALDKMNHDLYVQNNNNNNRSFVLE